MRDRNGHLGRPMAACLAVVLPLFASGVAWGQDVDKARKGLAAIPALKGVALGDLKASGKHFTVKLGSKKVSAIAFTTKSKSKLVWNVGIYPKNLGLKSLYSKAATRLLGEIQLSNPAVVISQATTKTKFSALPRPVQQGIQKVFGAKVKEVTYPAGVNVSFLFQVAKTPGLADLKADLGLDRADAPMAGTMAADLIGYLANGKRTTSKSHLEKIVLNSVVMPDSKKDDMLESFAIGAVRIVYRGDKKGAVQRTARTQARVVIGSGKEKSAYAFHAALTFDPKAKSADKKRLTIRGPLTPALKKVTEFGDHRARSLNLDAAVMGNRRLVVAFSGTTDKKKPFAVNAILNEDRKGDTLELEETFPDNPTVKDVIGYSRPGLDTAPFKNLKLVGDVVTGLVRLTGQDMQAYAYKPDAETDERHLALIPKVFDFGAWTPKVRGTILDTLKIDKSALLVVPDGGGGDLALKELPKLVADKIAGVVGSDVIKDNKNKLPIEDGLNAYVRIDVRKSPGVGWALDKLRIKERELTLVGSMSPQVFTALPDKVSASLKQDGDALKDTLNTFKMAVSIPRPQIKGAEKVLAFDDAVLGFRFEEEDDTQMVVAEIVSPVKLKLPGKTIGLESTLTIHKATGSKGFLIELEGASKVDWQRAFKIPFLNLNNIGLAGSIGDDHAGREVVDKDKDGKPVFGEDKTVRGISLGLNAEISLAGRKMEVAEEDEEEDEVVATPGIELVIENGGVADFALFIDGRLQLSKLPGIRDIPGTGEIAIENFRLSMQAVQGKVIWRRLAGYEASVAIVEIDDKQPALFIRVHDLEMKALFDKLPKPLNMLSHLKWPRAVLAMSSVAFNDQELGDLPDAAQDILEGIVKDEGNDVPIWEGLTLVGAIGEKDLPDRLQEILADDLGIFDYVDGDLVLAGGVQGVIPNKKGKKKGNISIGLYADLPGFKPPKNQPWSRIVSFDKAKTDFFIRADARATAISFGVGGEMQVEVPHLDDPKESDNLKFRGELYFSADLVSEAGGIKVAGRMEGLWREPFGWKNFAFENPSILMGGDSEGSVEFGIGATAEFKARDNQNLRYAMDMLANINFSTSIPLPKKLGFRIQGPKLSPFAYWEVVDVLFCGALTGPMAKVLANELKQPAERKAVQYLQKELKDRSLLDVFQIDKLPYPYIEYRDVDLYFATPGAVIPGREDTLDGMGVVITAKTSVGIMGKKTTLTEVDNRLTLQDGLRIKAGFPGRRLGPIVLHKAKVDAAANIFAIPHFTLRGDATLFGARQALDIELSKDRVGFGALLNLGPLLQVDMDAQTIGDNLFKAKAFEAKIKGAAIAGLAFTETTAKFDARSGLEFTSTSEIPIGLPLPPVGTLGTAKATADVKVNDRNGHRVYDIAFAAKTLGLGGAVGFKFEGTPRSIDVAYGARDKDGKGRHPCIPFSGNTKLSQGDLAAFAKRAAKGPLPPEAFRELVKFNADINLPSLTGAKDCGSRVLNLAKDIADKAAKAAEKLAREAAEAAKKAAELAARKAREETEKAAKLAAQEARKAAELAAREVKKASEQAAKAAQAAAEKAAEEGRRAAERAANEARKHAERAAQTASRKAVQAIKIAGDFGVGSISSAVDFGSNIANIGISGINKVGNTLKSLFGKGNACEGAGKPRAADWLVMKLHDGHHNDDNLCLEIEDCKDRRLQNIRWAKCTGAWNQTWTLDEDGQVRNERGGCLGAFSERHGTSIQLERCGGNGRLHAIRDFDGRLHLRTWNWNTNTCLQIGGSNNAILGGCQGFDDGDAPRIIWYSYGARRVWNYRPEEEWIKRVGWSREVFDPAFYAKRHPDVPRNTQFNAGRHGDTALLHRDMARHWILFGLHEGRQSSPNFDIRAYRDRYSDLKAKERGWSWWVYLRQWDQHGRNEGRNPKPNNWTPPIFALKGRDASAFANQNLVNARNLCADEESGTRNRGGPVVVGGCRPGDRQRWSHNDRGQIVTTNNLCLDIGSGRAAHGEALILWTCQGGGAGRERQRWRMAEAGRVQHIASGLCLDVTNNGNGGGRLVVANCASDLTQFWATKAPPGVVGKTFAGSRLRNVRNNCIDEASGKLTRGGNVIVWGCGDVARQNWTHNERAQIVTTNNLCLDVASGTARQGEPLNIWTCQGGGAGLERQRWGRSPDGRLHHMQSGMCLDAQNNGNAGGRLVLSGCAPTDTQVWTPIKAVKTIVKFKGRDASAFSGLHLANVNNLCADEFSGTLRRGGRVVVRDCNGMASRTVTHTARGHIATTNNLCLDIAGAKAIEGAWINFWSCENGGSGLQRQRWRIADVGRVQHIASGLCLDAENGGKVDGQLVLARCGGALTQYWIAKRAPAVTASAFVNSRLTNLKNMCVDEASGKLTRGGKMIVWACGDLFRQVWSHNTRGQIVTTNGLCLDVASGKARNGEAMNIWGCAGGGAALERQRWGRTTDGRLHHLQSGLCLDAKNNGNKGGELVLSVCRPEDTQVWTTVSAMRTTSAFATKQIINARNMCADEGSGRLTRGGKVIMWGCNNSSRQRWTHNSRGQIVTTNKLCLDLASGKARKGEEIIIWSCNGSGAGLERQRWGLTSGGRLRHLASGFCLDATNNGNARGQLVLSPCNATPTQKWAAR